MTIVCLSAWIHTLGGIFLWTSGSLDPITLAPSWGGLHGDLMTIGLGFDTGGTYTDAVLMNLNTREIICKAKSMTTREDLCIGIRGAIAGFNKKLLRKVGIVSLSSTLATNSVVEGKGCRVALICIGMEYNRSVPADHSVVIEGGHDLKGNEIKPLDERAAREFLESVRGHVDGLAITGYMAVRNPDHERRVKTLAKEILNMPVICGHELSSTLGFNERTATCIMNAKLVPIISELIASMRDVMTENGIHAPLMIVRGDGSLMNEAIARERPVETILSGPAASLIGAMHITGKRDAIVMDMGGTTTDIGILRDGKPRLEPEGAIIGGKRTRVVAAEIATSGIGGDSRIFANGNNVYLSSLRVYPICMAASRWDCVMEQMESLANTVTRPTPEAMGEQNVVLDSEMFYTLKIPEDATVMSASDMKLLRLLNEHPYSLNEAGKALDIHPFTFNTSRLESLGFVQRIGFTPTDVLHVDGTYREFNFESSTNAAQYLSRKAGVPLDVFITTCRERIRHKLSTELMRELISEETGGCQLNTTTEYLLDRAIAGTPGRDFGCSIKVEKPIIGIGAPARVYIRWVGEAFGTEVLVDENSDVGNAIGAITSSVSETIEILVKPETIGGTECPFLAFSRLGTFKYETYEEALADAERMATETVMRAVEEGGAVDINVSVDRDDKKYNIGTGKDKVLMETILRVTAAGKPKPFSPSNGLKAAEKSPQGDRNHP